MWIGLLQNYGTVNDVIIRSNNRSDHFDCPCKTNSILASPLLRLPQCPRHCAYIKVLIVHVHGSHGKVGMMRTYSILLHVRCNRIRHTTTIFGGSGLSLLNVNNSFF